ncbi:hypothetical protein KRP22_004476 [Phytophthora ramorum]|nr:hypothetical protein KRP22_13580 [Phytophthora ramorum]
MAKDNHSPSLDPLHSPGSDTPQQQQSPVRSTWSRAQDAAKQNQVKQDTADPMAKTKRRLFSTPLLSRSATASAASAASRIKSNLSTVTKLPTALKRTAANSGSANNNNKATVDRAPTIPSLSRSSTESSVKQEEAKAAPQHNRMFGIPSLMRIRTGSKDKTHSNPLPSPVFTASDCPLDSPEEQSEHSSRGNNSSENEAEINEAEHKSAANTASRFVMGVPAMLRRAVSNNHTPPSATAAAPLQKKSPDTSANSTPRGDFPEDDSENDRHSLLMMLQVPEGQRRSLIPLMAASEAW